MRSQLAPLFAVTAIAAGCYEANTIVCANGVLCPVGQACTGNDPASGKPLCGDEGEVAQCANAERSLCIQSDEGDGICVGGVCDACTPLLYECRFAEWTQVPSTAVGLNGVWVNAPNNAFAAGTGGTVLAYDGSQWQSQTITGGPGLVDVWGQGADVFTISLGGVVYRNGVALSDPAPSSLGLLQIWGRAADDLVAVGGEGLYGEFNGTSWDWQSFGGLTSVNNVWGTDSFALAVGEGRIRHRPGTRQAWAGADWLVIAPPNTSDTLLGVWGASATDFYVVGYSSVSTGVIHHYANGTWSAAQLPAGTPRLTAIWGSGPDEIHAVGDRGTYLRYDGSGWMLARPASDTTLLDISGSGRDAIAVGADGSIWRFSP